MEGDCDGYLDGRCTILDVKCPIPKSTRTMFGRIEICKWAEERLELRGSKGD